LAVAVHELDREISEMDTLVNELLGINRISDIKSLDKQLFVVEDVIEEIFGRLKEVNPNISKQLLYVAKSEYEVMANRQLFKRALQNLLFNAMRFAESRIIVKCYPESDVTVVEVCDDGPGIPPVERERIFRPFAIIEDSRTRESGGVGLGLAIVARIIEKHGGSVTVGESEIGGARFETKWPIGGGSKADKNNAFLTIT
jgi:two-component system sensor histidine kinase RstB